MSNKTIALAYCKDNANIAQRLVQHLATTDYKIQEISGEDFYQEHQLEHKLTSLSQPILLLVSDNFLKSDDCMNGALKMLQQLSARGRILPIITDGRIWDEKSQSFLYQNTSFEKVSNVIQYMNYWQERYLEVRRKKRNIEADQEAAFNDELKKVRSISSEVGEFLRHLRSLNFVSYEQLEHKQFEHFFKFMGDHKGLAAFKNAFQPEATLIENVVIANHVSNSALTEDIITAFQKGIQEQNKNTDGEVLDTSPLEMEDHNTSKNRHAYTEHWTNIEQLTEDVMSNDEVTQPANEAAQDDLIILEDIMNGTSSFKTNRQPAAEENLSAEASLEALENIFNEEPISPQHSTHHQIVLDENADDHELVTPITASTQEKEQNDNFIESLLNWMDGDQEEEVKKEAQETSEQAEIILENTEATLPQMEQEMTETLLQEDTIATEILPETPNSVVEEEVESNEEQIEILMNKEEELDMEAIIAEIVSVPDLTTVVLSETEEQLVTATQVEEAEIMDESIAQAVEDTTNEQVEILTNKEEELDMEPIIAEMVSVPDLTTVVLSETEEQLVTATQVEETKIIDESIAQAVEDTVVQEAMDIAEIEEEVIAKPVEQVLVANFSEEKKGSPADDLFQQAVAYEEAEDYGSARKYYEQVAELEDDYPEIHVKLGQLALYHFADARQASKHFKKAIKKDQGNAEVRYQYANLLYEYAEKPYKAARHFKDTLKLQPEHPFANYDLALIYYQLGDKFRANRAYLKAIEINPELKTEQNDLAFGYTPPSNIAEEVNKFHALQKDIQRLEQLLIAKQTQEVSKKKKNTAVKTVMITGATSGIGRATAELFAQHGYRLILTGRRKERLKVIKGFFKKNYQAEILTLPFDVRDLEAVRDAIDGMADEWRQVDLLINNAGLAKGISPIHEGDITEWDTMIDTNIKGLLYMTRAIAPQMVKRKTGHIINICSTSGKEVYAGGNVYCATKFAVDALTKSMRIDLHKHQIRVSQVSPAHVEETEFSVVRFNGDLEKANKVYEDFRPLNAKDVAETIYFIATQPPHVNVLDITLQGIQQASANYLDRSGR